MQRELLVPPTWRTRVRHALDLPVEIFRDFVWGDLRAGLIDLRGLDAPTRVLAVIGFALLVSTVAALLFNERWREAFTLAPQINGAVGRGSLVPDALLPVTFFLVAVACSYGLAGALHAHWLVRVAVNVLYLGFAIGWLNMTGSTLLLTAPAMATQGDWLQVGGMTAAVLAVPVIFIARAKRAARPAWEWLALFVCVAIFFVVLQARGVANWRQFEIPLIVGILQTNLMSYQGFVAPLLLLAGVNIALFTNQAAKWTTEAAQARLQAAWLFGLLALALALRGWTVLQETYARLGENGLASEARATLGALGLFGIIALSSWLVARLARGRSLDAETLAERVRGYALWLILAFGALQILEFILISAAQAIPPLYTLDAWRANFLAAVDFLRARDAAEWYVVAPLAAIAAGLALARRGAREMALYFVVTGGAALWYVATASNGWLNVLRGASAERVDLCAVLLLIALALFWMARRGMTVERAAGLFFLTLLTGLVRQTDFISSPFSPFLGFAGIGFVAFGILYDAITAGVWANAESKNFPRVSRIFLYLGYVLLGVVIVNWALASHNLNDIEQLTGSVAWRGMELFGLPLLYAVAAITLQRLKDREMER